jgi:hypothetical protein
MGVPQVGAWTQPMTYALPPPPVPALLPAQVPYYVAPPQPAPTPAYYPPPPVHIEEPPPPQLAVVSGPEPEEVGADPYASATAVLDQIARSGR